MAEKYEDSKLYRVRHSAAHVMAQAVLEKFPTGKVAIGPAIEDGFYYDFDLPRPLTPEDLEEIEGRMREIIKNNSPFEREEVSADEARKIFNGNAFSARTNLLQIILVITIKIFLSNQFVVFEY